MAQELLDVVTHVIGLDGVQHEDEYDFLCPVHSDRRPSAGVNLITGLWHCFTCGAGGDIVSLAMAVKGLDFPAAKNLVEPNTPEAMVTKIQSLARQALAPKLKKKLPELPGPYPANPMEYLLSRGFTDDTLRKYEAGYVAEERFQLKDRSYSIRDYVSLPIRDVSGRLLAYCYRTATGATPRYLYTPGAPLASLWFGVHLYPRKGQIVVTEGALDSMWVAQCGFPAIAALGANAEFKAGHLRRYDSVLLFMDRDVAGVHAAQRIGGMIADKMPVKVARYPSKVAAKDPAELSTKQVRRAIARAIPFKQWR